MAKEKMMQRTESVTLIDYKNSAGVIVSVVVEGKMENDYEILAAACKDAKEVAEVVSHKIITVTYKMPVTKFKELAEKYEATEQPA